jgi:CDP-diacylglycerol--glycerol-3-phosphate 3-phosphatidyltransferase
MTTSFGPSALVTPANAVTIFRVLLTPILLASILDAGPSWPAAVLWLVLGATDGVDGWLARRQGTTRSGAFLDPLADKFLVLGAMAALVAKGRFWWFPVALIAVREIAMSGYRLVMGQRGVSIPARRSAKLKTLCQEAAVGFALLPLTADDHRWLWLGLLWVAVGLTVATGLQYLADARTARAVAGPADPESRLGGAGAV